MLSPSHKTAVLEISLGQVEEAGEEGTHRELPLSRVDGIERDVVENSTKNKHLQCNGDRTRRDVTAQPPSILAQFDQTDQFLGESILRETNQDPKLGRVMEAATMRTRIERRFNRSGPEENRSTSGASAAMYSSRVVAVSLTSRNT